MNFRNRVAGLFYALLPAIFILMIFSNGGCSGGPAKTGMDGKTATRETDDTLPANTVVKVVTTIFPLADIVKQIGKDAVQVTALLPTGASPHTYEPTVEQTRAIAGADVLVFIGGGLDDWALKLSPANGKPVALGLMEHINEQLLTDPHRPGPADPHVWMDPLLVTDLIAPLITEELQAACPEESAFFAGNLDAYQQELETLHKEISALVASFSQKSFISYHSAWHYFAARYGLEEVATVEESPGKEPSAKWLSALVELANLHDIRVVFAEAQLGTKLAAMIAREIDGKVLLVDPLGGPGIADRESYLQLMRYNAKIFQQALQ